ncbi:MAG TPA: choice-of-anchor D domain-containing protein, partial [Vicinamibacteria bacterium]
MKPALAFIAVASVSLAARAGQEREKPEPPAPKPTVIQVRQHDVSPNLRDIPPFRPAEPEPLRQFHEEVEQEEERVREELIEAEERRGLVRDRARQTAPGAPLALTPGLNFDGIGSGIHGFTVSGAPPDTNGAVGASQYVQSVNSALAVYDKHDGALLLGPMDFRTLYAGFGGLCETNGGSDPVVLYDKLAERWVVSILVSGNVGGTPTNFECFAVSTTSDATGSYNRYAIPFDTKLNDFPKLGVWPDAYYFAANPFDQGAGGRLLGRNLCAIDREAALAGAPLQLVCFLVPLAQTSGAVLPTDIDGPTPPPPGTPNFFFVLGRDFASLRLFRFHVDFETPGDSTLSAPIDIPVSPFNRLCPGGACVPQAGSPQLLSSIGDVPNFRVAYRNFGDHEAVVLNHSVMAGGVGGVRWYEVRDPNGTPTLFQEGTFAPPDGSSRWMGSVATDKAGNIGVAYSVSGPARNPAVGITGRAPSDPPGTLAAELIAHQGAGAQTPTLDRWGDYSGMTVDPQDDCTFWYTTEYIPANGTFNWRTRILSFTLSGCVDRPRATLAPRSRAFGSVALGASSAPQALTFTNDGPGGLAVGGVAVTGDFTQTNNCPPTLAEGASCTIDVVFTPSAAGIRAGVLTVESDAGNGPHRAAVTGIGLDPAAGSTAVDFAAGFSAAGLSLNGGAALAGSRLRLTDGGANQARSAFFTARVPVEFFTTDFTFQLTGAVAEGFTLTFQGNDAARIGPGGSGLAYGGATGGIPNSVAVKIDLANSAGEGPSSSGVYTGGLPPTVPALNMIPAGVNVHTADVFFAHFTYDGNTLAWTLTNTATGKSFSASALVDIPAEVGAATAFVGFTASTGGGANTATQDILGWTFQTPGVVAPFVSLSPRSLAFGSVEAGAASAPQAVTVTNNGPGPLTLGGIATEGDFTQSNDCGASLAEGASCTVSLSFAPAAAGTRQGLLVLTDDAFNGAQRARLIGTGLQAGVPAVVDFRAGFAGGPTGLQLNNGAAVVDGRLRITTNTTGLARSAFTVRPVNVASFNADFTFQNSNATADGFTFALQRSAPTALGASGGGLGYAGIPGSIAVKFDIFSSQGEGTSSTGLYRNGAFPGVPALDLTPAGIILRSNDVFYVHLGYDGAILSWTITNARTGARFEAQAAIDIPAAIGGPAAYAGFTGGTGGLTATQDV